MLVMETGFEQDLLEYNHRHEGDRIGRRIRQVRMARGMTQAQLGKKIGLSADRVQKYENGYRKPKDDMLKKIAKALGVEAVALADPVVGSGDGALYALFNIERISELSLEKHGANCHIVFSHQSNLYEHLETWRKEFERVQSLLEVATSDKEREKIKNEYEIWKYTYPQALIDETKRLEKKRALKETIDRLQKELDKME